MNKTLTKKIIGTLLIALCLLIPLGLIQGKINERERHQNFASQSIAKSWTGKQKIIGPIIVIPYEIQWIEKKSQPSKSNMHHYSEQVKTSTRYHYLVPKTITANFSVNTSSRYKGIFKIPVYHTDIHMEGELEKAQINEGIANVKQSANFHKINTPYMIVSVSDPRGFSQTPQLTLGSNTGLFSPGTLGHSNNSGAHLVLENLLNDSQEHIPFKLSMALNGLEQLAVLPVAEQANISMTSNWPHPSFGGDQIPQQRTISQEGFKATWQVSSFSNQFIQQLKNCVHKKCGEKNQQGLHVTFIETVDIYLQSERSVKYGFLFILLTFATFYIVEVIKRKPIHPIQYTLIGLALAIFYLLLVSLSEHIAFIKAYTVAALACITLLGTYVRFVLNNLKETVQFGIGISLLYATLYIVIQAEDFALLMGSTVVFIALTAIMWTTRKINWYDMEQDILSAHKIKSKEVSQ